MIRYFIAAGLATLFAAGITHIATSAGPSTIRPEEASAVVGGDITLPLSDCVAPACASYNCEPYGNSGGYRKTRANTHKRCQGPHWSSCGNNGGSTDCIYDMYLDSGCSSYDYTNTDTVTVCS